MVAASTSPPAGPEPVLAGRGLSRRYRDAVALDGVDVALRAGESLALLGPNGAGKTTLLSLLAGVERPDAGAVEGTVGPRGAGWVPQRPSVYGRLSARENLVLFAGLERAADPEATAAELLARADLTDVADRAAGTLSTGMLQRLNLAIALAGNPPALLLDEPTATLSPEQRIRLWAWLEGLRADGMALLFATQSVGEALRRGSRVLVLVDGRVRFAGAPAALAAAVPGDGDATERAERAYLDLVGGRGR